MRHEPPGRPRRSSLVLASLVLALALPPAMGAQSSAPAPTPVDPVMFTFERFADIFGSRLVAAFDSIPAARYDYRPTPSQQSIGYIAQHLEDANYSLCARFANLEHRATTKDSLADTIKARWPKDTLVARVRVSFEFCNSALASLRDGALADQLPLGAPGSGRTIGRAQYLVAYVTDLADHWAQIAGYMRLNGMIPPSAMPRPTS